MSEANIGKNAPPPNPATKAKNMNPISLPALPLQSRPNWATPSMASTRTRACLRPIRSDIHPTTPRPTPLTIESTPADEAAMNGPKPTSVAKSTW